MDPQKLASLDPKLREAYARVMGTTIPQTQTTPIPQQNEPAQAVATTIPPNPISDPASQPAAEPQVTAAQPEPFFVPQPATNPQPEPAQPPQPATNFVQMNSEAPIAPVAAPVNNFSNFATPAAAPQAQTVALKKKSGMTPILFGIVGVIFIVIYTLFWTKIFNLKLPFLP